MSHRWSVEMQDGDIVVRRRAARVGARQDAEVTAEEIFAESRRHLLGGVSIWKLLEDGRRG